MSDWNETHRATLELIERLRRDVSQIAFEMHPETYPGAVRDVLNRAADALDAALKEIDRLLRRVECDGWRIEDAKVEIDRLTKVAVTPCACGENEGCSECRRIENPPHDPPG